MTTPTITKNAGRSAYPSSVDELIPRSERLAVRLGGVPSRNRLMKEFSVGAPKATALRQALLDSGLDFARLRAAKTGSDGDSANPGEPGLTEDQTRDLAGEVTAEPGPARLHLVANPADSTPPKPEPRSASEDRGADPVPESGTTPGGTVPSQSAHTAGDRVAEPVGRESKTQAGVGVDPGTAAPVRTPGRRAGRVSTWPVLLLALPAFVAIWSGWVGLGGLTGFGTVHPLPGIWDSFTLNTAITLPIGMETYAAYALRVWLSGQVPARARRFAKWSAFGSLALGSLGQVAYHLMEAADVTAAPWPITTLVASLPVAVLGMGAALGHLIRDSDD